MKSKTNGVMGRSKVSTLKLKTSKNDCKKKKKKPSSSSGVADGGCSRWQCCECGKMFKSRKAMFGHLRSHPDRDWRGFKNRSKKKAGPPPGTASSFELEAAAGLLMLAAGRSPVKARRTARRGRRLRTKPPSATDGCGAKESVSEKTESEEKQSVKRLRVCLAAGRVELNSSSGLCCVSKPLVLDLTLCL